MLVMNNALELRLNNVKMEKHHQFKISKDKHPQLGVSYLIKEN